MDFEIIELQYLREVLKIMIETNRLILRLMNEKDIDDMLMIFTDKNVMKSFNLHSFSREQMKKWVDRNLNHQNEYGYGLFSVILKSNQELIGDCGLEHTEFEEKPCTEIGYDFLANIGIRVMPRKPQKL